MPSAAHARARRTAHAACWRLATRHPRRKAPALLVTRSHVVAQQAVVERRLQVEEQSQQQRAPGARLVRHKLPALVARVGARGQRARSLRRHAQRVWRGGGRPEVRPEQQPLRGRERGRGRRREGGAPRACRAASRTGWWGRVTPRCPRPKKGPPRSTRRAAPAASAGRRCRAAARRRRRGRRRPSCAARRPGAPGRRQQAAAAARAAGTRARWAERSCAHARVSGGGGRRRGACPVRRSAMMATQAGGR